MFHRESEGVGRGAKEGLSRVREGKKATKGWSV